MTLQKIKSDYANEQGYLTWGLLLEEVTGTVILLNHMNEIAKRYATECAKASLEKAAENATAYIPFEGEPPLVAKGSIIDHTNIVLL